MAATFTDMGQTLEDFVEIIYVHCPRCQKCAQVRRIPSNEGAMLADDTKYHSPWRFQRCWSSRKLSCLHCSYTSLWKEQAQQRGGPYDWYFQLPLWLQTPCCGETLWAFNEEHVSFLEHYVSAKQRSKFHVVGQVRNGTMASRLPLWIKSAKNREEVIKGIERLKTLLEK